MKRKEKVPDKRIKEKNRIEQTIPSTAIYQIIQAIMFSVGIKKCSHFFKPWV